jgi:predicted dehydrogenase
MFGFASGMSGSLLSCIATAVSYRLAVFGTKGCAELLTPELDFHFTPTPEAMPAGRHTQPPPEIIEHRRFNAIAAELEAFAAAIRGEAPYPIPADEVLHGVAVFEAIVRSAATHQPVKVARD